MVVVPRGRGSAGEALGVVVVLVPLGRGCVLGPPDAGRTPGRRGEERGDEIATARVRVRILVAIVGDVSRNGRGEGPVDEAIEGRVGAGRGVERGAPRGARRRGRRDVAPSLGGKRPGGVRETVRVGGGDGSCRRAMVRAAFAAEARPEPSRDDDEREDVADARGNDGDEGGARAGRFDRVRVAARGVGGQEADGELLRGGDNLQGVAREDARRRGGARRGGDGEEGAVADGRVQVEREVETLEWREVGVRGGRSRVRGGADDGAPPSRLGRARRALARVRVEG